MAHQAFDSFWQFTSAGLGRLFGKPGSRLPVVLNSQSPVTFPDPSGADATGLIAIGGDLSVERLLSAYRAGIFPWYDETTPILWWSPDPRGIIEIEGLHVSRRLMRKMRSGKYRATFDTVFTLVMGACSIRDEGTWITPEMVHAYEKLHKEGHAHSVEVWEGEDLVGGVYGVSVGGLFAGESMFSFVSDGSKMALAYLFERLRNQGFTLFDCQHVNDHTSRLGAIEISRKDYLRRLNAAIRQQVTF